jgi:hypothetical protein
LKKNFYCMRFLSLHLSMRLLGLSAVVACAADGSVEVSHWAYVLPVAAKPPGEQGVHPVDAFLGEARKKAGITAANEVAPRKWLERVSYSLTGLLPTEAHLQRIESTPDDATRAAIVDELMASPAYGERWARHWMDVARYADTSGYNFDQDNRYPFAYTYRDWLISAFNRDLPYADFVQLQIAADLIVPEPNHPDLAALGFLTVGPRAGQEEIIDDRVDVVTRGFLASTVSCARCHDHKSDPITTEDYYSLHSIFSNTTEPDEKPEVGEPADREALAGYREQMAKLEAEDLAARQALVDHWRSREGMAVYLDLGWRAKQEQWDHGQATSQAFKRGRYRGKAVLVWRDWLKKMTTGGEVLPELAAWDAEMSAADDEGKKAASMKLADAWIAAGLLEKFAKDSAAPMSYGVDRISSIMDVEDDNARRVRLSQRSRLQMEHSGSPPRAMVLKDKPEWSRAVVYKRGNPATKGPPFEREWLSFLGGGEFPKGISPRLSLARKIADPTNPLTARVMVNRVWAWHFGAPLADPGDFGVQQAEPPLRPLLDWLAVWFIEHGGSVKALNRLLVTSQAFRLAAEGPTENNQRDEANAYFWKWNRQRLEFEVMRDRLLATSGGLNLKSVGGRSIKLDDPAGDSRRSVYAFIDRYALPGIFVSFDLPHPDHMSSARSQTTVPQQALHFLNGPLLLRRAAMLADDTEFKELPDEGKVRWLYQRLFRRDPKPEEVRMISQWVSRTDPADYLPKLGGVWEIRHAPDRDTPPLEVREFPLFQDKVWKTGPDPATAPIRWLQAGARSGHVSTGHALVLRWRALGAGEVKMSGHLKRTQKGGEALVWRMDGKGTDVLAEGSLAPETDAPITGDWIKVNAGDTLDFVLRAPQGDAFGGVNWNFEITGRESESAKPSIISHLERDFPEPGASVMPVASPDPWADVIQMLWASNEFNFID